MTGQRVTGQRVTGQRVTGQRVTGRLLAAFLALSAVTVIGFTAYRLTRLDVPVSFELPPTATIPEGSTPGDFTLVSTAGDTVRLSDQRGRVVIVSFWATWSEPSMQQLRMLDRLSATLEGRDVTILAVNVDGGGQVADALTDDLPADARVIVLRGSAREQLEYAVSTLPTLLVIDRQGRLQQSHVGYLPGMEGRLLKKVEALLDP